MIYKFIYEPNYERIIPAIIIDARASIPEIQNKTGFEIKAYIDKQLFLVTNNSIVYKIEETNNGVLCGFFSINVEAGNKTATLVLGVLRPAFEQFKNEINLKITNFIMGIDTWQQDYLFPSLN